MTKQVYSVQIMSVPPNVFTTHVNVDFVPVQCFTLKVTIFHRLRFF